MSGRINVARRSVDRRYAAIWVAFSALVIVALIIEPRAVSAISWKAILPLAGFIAIVSVGQALVIRTGGIDLSAPSVMGIAALMLRTLGGGADGTDRELIKAIVVALLLGLLIGLVNGALVVLAGLTPLIVTLATGAFVAGYSVWYQETHEYNTSVPDGLADFGTSSVFGINGSVYVAVAVVVVSAVILTKTAAGRRFTAAGTNPVAAKIAGIPVAGHTIAGYAIAGLLYAIGGILLSGFLGSPTLNLGATYLLTPIVAVVLAGTALGGGGGSMTSILGAALFLGLLSNLLRTTGLTTATQNVLEGTFVIAGMAFASVDRSAPAVAYVRRRLHQKGAASVARIT